VDDALILETSVLVDLERESRTGQPGRAHRALEHHADRRLFISATIAGEIAAGLTMRDRERWTRFLAPFPWLPMDEGVAWHFGETYHYLSRTGQLIGTNDLWIAATGLAHAVPVATTNGAEFGRVPGLEVVNVG
jgi:predicted nucleic acid-binding protein